MMIVRLLLLVFVCLLTSAVKADICMPNMTPEQAFLAVTNGTATNRSTTKQATNPLANPPKLININQATEAELTQLEGIGAKKAQQIILYRQLIAPFATADDLANVKGIGKATIDKNRQRIITK